ncbi:MAG: hypothetical protein JXA43_03245 [Candidatus Diapherotrites archaeon]|nr:hypothetical protein [Candidatus Diapherotrites archaeon]
MERIDKILDEFAAKTKVENYTLSKMNGEIVRSNHPKKKTQIGLINSTMHHAGTSAHKAVRKGQIDNITIATKNSHVLGRRHKDIILLASARKSAKVDKIHEEMAKVTKRLEKLV